MYKSNKSDEHPEMLDLALVHAKIYIIFNETAHFEKDKLMQILKITAICISILLKTKQKRKHKTLLNETLKLFRLRHAVVHISVRGLIDGGVRPYLNVIVPSIYGFQSLIYQWFQ